MLQLSESSDPGLKYEIGGGFEAGSVYTGVYSIEVFNIPDKL